MPTVLLGTPNAMAFSGVLMSTLDANFLQTAHFNSYEKKPLIFGLGKTSNYQLFHAMHGPGAGDGSTCSVDRF